MMISTPCKEPRPVTKQHFINTGRVPAVEELDTWQASDPAVKEYKSSHVISRHLKVTFTGLARHTLYAMI